MATITTETLLDAPCPRVGITVEGLGVGDSVVSVWRTADGERHPVRGARRTTIVDAGFITDYDAPLERPVTYELEVLSGPSGPDSATSEPVTVPSATAWLMDPLVPHSAVPVLGTKDSDGSAYFRSEAMAELEYAADASMITIMGSDAPMMLFGQVMKARGIPLAMSTRSAEQNVKLKRLLQSTAQFVFRPIPGHGWDLPGTMHIGIPSKVELPVDVSMGGSLTRWDMRADTVQAPVLKVLTATYTWGDVAIMFATYQQKQDAVTGTYLDDLKNPFG